MHVSDYYYHTYTEIRVCSHAALGCRSEVECLINVLCGADGAGPGKLYGPRGRRLITAVSDSE